MNKRRFWRYYTLDLNINLFLQKKARVSKLMITRFVIKNSCDKCHLQRSSTLFPQHPPHFLLLFHSCIQVHFTALINQVPINSCIDVTSPRHSSEKLHSLFCFQITNTRGRVSVYGMQNDEGWHKVRVQKMSHVLRLDVGHTILSVFTTKCIQDFFMENSKKYTKLKS